MDNPKFPSETHKIRGGMLSIHVAIILFGLAGLFGKFLEIEPILIVQGRTLIAFVALLPILYLMRIPVLFQVREQWIWLGVTGCILAVHWVGFFCSIQISSVAIGLLSFSCYPLFATILEPVLFHERFCLRNIFATLVVILGLAIIATSGSTESSFGLSKGIVLKGMAWGLFAGFSFAILTLLNRKHVQQHSPLTVACWQNGFAALVLLPLSLGVEWEFSLSDIGLLLLLGLFCTAVGHVMLINGLRRVSVQLTSMLHAGLEPMYAIFFALIILNEVPGVQILAGGGLILGVSIFISLKHAAN